MRDDGSMSDADDIRQLKIEVAELRRLVDELYHRSGTVRPEAGVSTAEPPADVVQAIQAGNIIQAIKLWRGYTNVTLAEAKHQVEQIQARLY